ncbi:unnamed protein product, partial [Allacma fusca]
MQLHLNLSIQIRQRIGLINLFSNSKIFIWNFEEQELKLPLGVKLPLPNESDLTSLQHWLQNQENHTKLSVYLS